MLKNLKQNTKKLKQNAKKLKKFQKNSIFGKSIYSDCLKYAEKKPALFLHCNNAITLNILRL